MTAQRGLCSRYSILPILALICLPLSSEQAKRVSLVSLSPTDESVDKLLAC
jgi:hypothetical protein